MRVLNASLLPYEAYLHSELQLRTASSTSKVMEDAIRPNEQAFKAMYDRGYLTWYNLFEATLTDSKSHLPVRKGLYQLENAFPDYPAFPADLEVATNFSNDALVYGTSTW
jgi:hypothetical protein